MKKRSVFRLVFSILLLVSFLSFSEASMSTHSGGQISTFIKKGTEDAQRYLQDAIDSSSLNSLTLYIRIGSPIYTLTEKIGHGALQIFVFVQDGALLREVTLQYAIDNNLLCPSTPSLFKETYFFYQLQSTTPTSHNAQEIMITINGAEEDLQSLVAQQAFCTPPAIPLPPIPPPECDMTKDWEGDPKANTNIVYINPADGQRYIAGSSPVKFDTDSGGEYFSDDGDTKTTTNKLCQLALRSKDGRSVYYILDNLYDFDDENMWEWVNDPSGPVDLVYGNAGFWRQQLTGGEGFISFIKCTLCPDKCGDSVKDPWEACDLGPGGKRVLGSCRFCDDGTLTGICEQGCTKYRTRCTGGTPDGLSCI